MAAGPAGGGAAPRADGRQPPGPMRGPRSQAGRAQVRQSQARPPQAQQPQARRPRRGKRAPQRRREVAWGAPVALDPARLPGALERMAAAWAPSGSGSAAGQVAAAPGATRARAAVDSCPTRGHAEASRDDSAGSSAGSGGAGTPLVGRGHIRAWFRTLGQVPVPGIIPPRRDGRPGGESPDARLSP